MVEWEAPLLGCLAGCLYAVTPDGICVTNDPEEETIFELKSGSKPSGIQQLRRWSDDTTKPYPDSPLATHVLQINLQAVAREMERTRRGQAVKPSVLKLIYGSPLKNEAEVFTLPATYVFNHIDADIDIGRHRRRHTIRH